MNEPKNTGVDPHPTTVPFHHALLDTLDVSIGEGFARRLPGSPSDRRVEVWNIEDGAGSVLIKIFRTANDGKTSLLQFALTKSAAQALAEGLHFCLYPDMRMATLPGERGPNG